MKLKIKESERFLYYDAGYEKIITVNKFTKEAEVIFALTTKEMVEEIKRIVKDLKIKKITIRSMKESVDLSFLCEYANDVEELFVCVSGKVRNWFSKSSEGNFLKCFKKLKKLWFWYGSKETCVVDFNWFPELEILDLDPYWPNAKNVFDIPTLKKFSIRYYPYKDLEKLKGLRNLESLKLLQPTKLQSFKGCEYLDKLKCLYVYYAMRLKSLEYLDKLKNLEYILIGACGKHKNIEPLSKLKNLKVIKIDKIVSLKPLDNSESVDNIRIIWFLDIIDGDISTMLKWPNLEMVSIYGKTMNYSEKEIRDYIRWRKPVFEWVESYTNCEDLFFP